MFSVYLSAAATKTSSKSEVLLSELTIQQFDHFSVQFHISMPVTGQVVFHV